MSDKNSSHKKGSVIANNTLETLKNLGSSTVHNTVDSFKKLGTGMFDQLIGINQEETEKAQIKDEKDTKKSVSHRKEFTIFNYQEYYEFKLVKDQIKMLTDAIKKEIEAIKLADRSMLAGISDIEKISIDSLPEKPGVYHVRFLEIVLNLLRTLRLKIGESKTWLQALVSKKKKRGSLFAALTKKKGTQYSLSQELQSARSIQ